MVSSDPAPAQVGYSAFGVTKVSLFTVILPLPRLGIPASKVTNVSLFTVISPLPRWGSCRGSYQGIAINSDSVLAHMRYSRRQIYQSIAFYSGPTPRDAAPAHVRCIIPVLEGTKVLLFTVIPPLPT